MTKCIVTDAGRECTSCRITKVWSHFCKGSAARGRVAMCLSCRNTRQRSIPRKARQFRYEKTKKGFLVRLYHNMQSRINGVQKLKWHLYAGLKLLPREKFYSWALKDPEFHQLFGVWETAGYPMKLTPSVDRVDSFYGYETWNMEWVTHSENSRRATTHGMRGAGYAA